MLIVKIISDGLEDRFVNLSEGIHTVGSNISSDIVLLDDGIDSLHFTVSVSLQRVEVEMSPDSSGILQGNLEDGGRPVEPGTVLQWTWGDTLTLGGTRIQMQGDMLRNPAPTASQLESGGKTGGTWRIKLMASVAVGLFAGILLLTQVGAVETAGASAALDGAEIEAFSPEMAAVSQPIKLNRQQVLAALQERGIVVVSFAPLGDGWTGAVRVASRAEQMRVEASLAPLAPHFTPRFYADDRLAEAAAVVIKSIAPTAGIDSVESGVITIGGIAADAQKVEMLRSNLMADVPGLLRVVFDSGQQQSVDVIGSKIAGTWAGEFPYVLLEDGRTIRPGEEIDKGAVLVQVRQEVIVIEFGMSRHEIKLHVVHVVNTCTSDQAVNDPSQHFHYRV